jgi:hypothetical protein
VWLFHAWQCHGPDSKFLKEYTRKSYGQWLIHHGLWSPRDIYLNQCDYYSSHDWPTLFPEFKVLVEKKLLVFQERGSPHVEKHLQKVWILPSWRSALFETILWNKLRWTVVEIPGYAQFLHDNASVTAVVFRNVVNDTLCI